MKIIGLTGGIASGKSTVTETLRDLGAHIINTDQVAHECMEPGKLAWDRIIQAFGKPVLQENQQIDRKRLGEIVFSNPEKLKQLNALMHPIILQETHRRVQEFAEENPRGIIVEEIPLLYEIHLDEQKIFQEIWVVWVDRTCQIKRLMNRDQCSYTAAVQRLAAQMDLDEKARKADRIINNMGSKEETIQQIKAYFSKFKEKWNGRHE